MPGGMSIPKGPGPDIVPPKPGFGGPIRAPIGGAGHRAPAERQAGGRQACPLLQVSSRHAREGALEPGER
eukprot:CAMPEP_0183796212 /NCGR_PEP_ID=MMETSP0803_2-20130417/9049_1 /TAXON_ID=195967 /ORGANISM="Crustomastix stigmata, Strain CCMP3273" /LENGTH=69 /DNA_ID=CAMNT_0026040831 /DNA_START=46 /DNA_END=251 /DNA_ORIENTATION=+